MTSRVNRVARAFCSFSSELSWAADVRRLGARAGVGAEHLHQAHLLGGVALAGGGGGLLGRDRHQVAGRTDRVADADDARGEGDDVVSPDARVLVARQPRGQADVRLGGAGGVQRHRRVDPVATGEQGGDRLDRRGAQPHVPRPRADRDDDVLDRGGAQHPHGARRGLLERLEQGIGGALGEPVGILDDDHPEPSDRGAVGRERDEVAGLRDRDRQPLGGDDVDVGVGAAQRRAALATLAAAAVGAEQRRGEGPGRDRAPRPGRPGEQPRMGHRAGLRTACSSVATALSCPMTSRHTLTGRPAPSPRDGS